MFLLKGIIKPYTYTINIIDNYSVVHFLQLVNLHKCGIQASHIVSFEDALNFCYDQRHVLLSASSDYCAHYEVLLLLDLLCLLLHLCLGHVKFPL